MMEMEAMGRQGNRESIYVSTIDKDTMESTFNFNCLSAEFRHHLGILPEEEQELTDIFKEKLGLNPLDPSRLGTLVYQKSKTISAYPSYQLIEKYFKNAEVKSFNYIERQITSPLLAKHNVFDTQASIYIFAAIKKFIEGSDLPLDYAFNTDKPYIPVLMRVQMMLEMFCYNRDEQEDDIPKIMPKTEKNKKFSIKKIMQKTIGKAYGRKGSTSSTSSSISRKRGQHYQTYEQLLSELNDQLELVQFIVSHGIMRQDLKDEIFVQLCCQMSHPDTKISFRAFILHSMCASCFLPSPSIISYYISHLHSITDDSNKELVDSIFQKVFKTNDNGYRFHPSSSMELKAELHRTPMQATVHLVGGRKTQISLLPSTTSREACNQISQQLGIEDSFGFSLYLNVAQKASSLGFGSDYVMDAITECENVSKSSKDVKKGITNKGVELENEEVWIMAFRKEFFTPWYDPTLDKVASELVYHQIKEGLKVNELSIPQPIKATVLAQLLYLELGPIASVSSIEDGLKGLVMSSVLNDARSTYKEVLDVANRLSLDQEGRDKNEIKCNFLSMASKYFSMNFSALFEAYNYGQIQGLELGEVILALNGKGVYVLDSKLTLIYAQFKFHDLLYASAIKQDEYASSVLSLVAVDGFEYRLVSPHFEVISKLIMAFLNGLKRRSSWGLAVKSYVIQDFRDNQRFSTLTSKNQSFELKQGDVVELSGEAGRSDNEEDNFLYGTCERSGLSGFFPLDVVYIIPISNRPSAQYFNDLKMLSSEMTTHTQTLFKKSGIIMADSETIKKVPDSTV